MSPRRQPRLDACLLSVPELARCLHGVVLQFTNGVTFVAEQAQYANTMANGCVTAGNSFA